MLNNILAHEKIHVRETQGRYTSLRWASVWISQLLYFGVPWLQWNGRPLLLFDFAARKLYLFGFVLWPQDLIYLAIALMLGICALLLSSAIVGRLWCGFGCPHTVYTEIFLWVERTIEGGRGARIRLEREAWSLRKFGKKLLKHGTWGLFAFWIGFTFVAYFTPIRILLQELTTATLPPRELFWIACYGLLAYLNAGLMREQICRHACPFARLQSVAYDADTLVIAYDAARGEPRGLRNRKHAAQGRTLGDCIDCTMCIQVCPSGSDIRQGLHADCMGCAACIDACNLVMDKIGAPRGLIRYATNNALGRNPSESRIRPRQLAGVLLLAAFGLLAMSLALRVPLTLDVTRDRGVPLTDGDGAVVENVYRLHVMNTDERAHRFRISVSGMDTLTLATVAEGLVEANASRVLPVRILVARGKGRAGSNEILFALQDQDDPRQRATAAAVFVVPRDRL